MRHWVLLILCLGVACQHGPQPKPQRLVETGVKPTETGDISSFTIRLSQGFATAFKTSGGYAVSTTRTSPVIDITGGTSFIIRFNNVPSGVRLRACQWR